MDFIIKKVDGIGYLPIVLDEYSNEIYRGGNHQKAHDAIIESGGQAAIGVYEGVGTNAKKGL